MIDGNCSGPERCWFLKRYRHGVATDATPAAHSFYHQLTVTLTGGIAEMAIPLPADGLEMRFIGQEGGRYDMAILHQGEVLVIDGDSWSASDTAWECAKLFIDACDMVMRRVA